MASDEEWEDGEILEEGEEQEPAPEVTPAAPKAAAPPLPSEPPRAPKCVVQAERPVSKPAPPLPPRSSDHRGSAASYPPRSRHQEHGSHYEDDRTYSADLIVKYPRQDPRSRVLLNFATWMATARMRKRLAVEDVQSLLLHMLKPAADGQVSEFLLPSLFPGRALPSRVCVVLLGNLHPSVVQKYRTELPFFDSCSSMPTMLAKYEQARRVEAPLPELLYRFPKPRVDTRNLPMDELFYAHELTFLMEHSFGYVDELLLSPAGTFTRRSQPLGGTWSLDGEMLSLKWRRPVGKASTTAGATNDAAPPLPATTNDSADDDNFTLDVLVSEDGTMHYFSTNELMDEMYARDTPEHLVGKKRKRDGEKRSIRLSLVKASAVDVARSADGAVVLPSTKPETATNNKTDQDESNGSALTIPDESEFNYYVLSDEELRLHGFPMDVDEEQRMLEVATNGNTRDRYRLTQPRPKTNDESSEPRCFAYALDCEMCETDLGMELTRVTVVDFAGRSVYDQLVKPQSTILNYHTEFSGISAETLLHTTHTVADVQRELMSKFLFDDTILVGHSLTSDLRSLRLVHHRIADTAMLYPHQRGFPFRTSLKYLTKTYLDQDIQTLEQAGHDSGEDAIAAMNLLLLKVRNGPWFGVPEPTNTSGAFDSLVAKTAALGKTMAVLRFAATDDIEVERKPWEQYASGDLRADLQRPIRHAQALKAKQKDTDETTATLTVVDECQSWPALRESVKLAVAGESQSVADVCWLEIDAAPSSASDFVDRHSAWMTSQREHCAAVDAFLADLSKNVLPSGTLLLAVPQGDLSLLRHLKAMRTRAKWRDSGAPGEAWTDEMNAATGDAFRGAMDSCVFLSQPE